ncbi:alpha-(1,3)-fucosyltransferase C-like [Epargyreus clarus]|uniref:alpha-(1,3)-fucosyltransferase C-like n=1 Tax=Epargyreus clarus TaxID=520877 RepID=UPI003C2DFC6B
MQCIVKGLSFFCSKMSMAQLLLSIFLCGVIHLWFLQYVYNFAGNFHTIMSIARKKNNINKYPNDSKYILLWNDHFMGIKNIESYFRNLNCTKRNCVFTKDKNLFYDVMRFDAIIFSELALNSKDRPSRRSKTQLYIFSSQEPSCNSPACELYNDKFFNLTFTYRLDSDVVWSYFVVRNVSGAVVAPRINATFKTSVKPVSSEIKSILSRKRKTAAWVVDHCQADSSRDEYLTRLQEHLFHFSLKIDVYGKCSRMKCPDNNCERMIKENYYFYMAFEDFFTEDYVTEKVLLGYNNYAVPIVHGGANYTRFLPPGSYMNAREIHPYNLAYAMHKVIKEPALHETYFRWTNLYTIEPNSGPHHPLCNLCERIQDESKESVKNEFRLWWNGLNGMKWCLSDAYWKENSNVNLDSDHIFHLG